MTAGILFDDAARERLRTFLKTRAQAEDARISNLKPLTGGAIQENWALDLDLAGGPLAGHHDLVLRADAPSQVAASNDRSREYVLVAMAHQSGVLAPKPYWLCSDTAVLGRVFYLMQRMPGIAAGRRIVKDLSLGGPRDALAQQLAAQLAKIHRIKPPIPGTHASAIADDLLGAVSDNPGLDRVGLYRRYLDDLEQSRPVIEWGLRWLQLKARPPAEVTFVHQDFRTGNYLVDEHGLTAILDWEFCAWGDPMSDIGWFCAKCWRFGAYEREAGGIASRQLFYDAYEQASGRRIDADLVRYWEVAAHVRWAVIALQQAARHLSGAQPSLELALTGRIVPELELDILNLIDAAEGRAA